MTDAELDELVRRNYTVANKSYLMEQQRIARKGKQMSRYIDADAFMQHIIDDNDGYLLWLSVMDIKNYVDGAPTIDVEPVVHAHWIKSNYDKLDGTIYKCSNCNQELFSAWNFCPHCGAKMDEATER